MKYKCSDRYRNIEIREMFETVLKLRLNAGYSYPEARQSAYEAIELRFHISETRTRIIINENARENTVSKLPLFVAQNIEMIKLLKDIINEHEKLIDYYRNFLISPFIKDMAELYIANYQNKIESNKKLIHLLEEVNAEYKRHR